MCIKGGRGPDPHFWLIYLFIYLFWLFCFVLSCLLCLCFCFFFFKFYFLLFCFVYHIKVFRSSHNAFLQFHFSVYASMDTWQIDTQKHASSISKNDSWIKAFFSEYKNYAVNFSKTTTTVQQQQQQQQQFITFHFKWDSHNFFKRIQFLYRFNESPNCVRLN